MTTGLTKLRVHRLRTMSAVLAAMLIAAATFANAQQWPTRPIRVISPYPAGSASDTVSRVVLDEVSRLIGQPVVIEMRPGAGCTRTYPMILFAISFP
jgi:tripartite-type tricarboxylate transporter receptor subunit TctC